MKPKASTVSNFTSPKPMPESVGIKNPTKNSIVKIEKNIKLEKICENKSPTRIE